MAGHVAQVGEDRIAYRVLVGKQKETGGLYNLGIERITLKWIIQPKDGCGLNSSGSE
jgi:hypothetical protein